MDVQVGPWRKLKAKESMLLNCSVGEDSWVPWTARRSNKSILKEISREYSLEGLMLNLNLQYFGHPMQRTDSLEKTLILGKTVGQGEKGTTEDEMVGWHHQLNGHEFEQSLGVGDEQRRPACCSAWGSQTVRHNWVTELYHLCSHLLSHQPLPLLFVQLLPLC